MRILVTGNMGYVGSVLTPFLADRGHEVWGYDAGFYKECLLGGEFDPRVARQIVKDVRRVEPADLEGVQAIVHLAALSNDPTGELNPGLTDAINTQGTRRMAEAARAAGAGRMVLASSCSIYGQSDQGALTEEAPFNPQTAYARSKVDGEAALTRLADDRFSPVFLRFATAYGLSPRLRFDIAVNNLTGWGFTTGKVKLMSDGRAWRPMVHVEDMARAIAAALEAPAEAVHARALNIGAESENYQIRDIANTVAEVVPGCEVTFAEGASADNRTYNVSFAKVRRVLPAFAPQWNVRRGIEQLHRAFREAGLTFEQFDGRFYTRLKQLRYLMEGARVDEMLFWR
ncbi:MAG: SDR family oxidoreductase [Armatimonadetes bacterium]|nr:SDR family oxidoreductase [Armatimonadota bacterium]